MAMTPEVSIITPCHNSEKFLSETIQSVLQQTFKSWEMILVDDASQDKTRKIIQSIQTQDTRFKSLYFDENVGPAVARNKGIEMATGRYIAFLDSDDLWLEHKLELQVSFMKANACAFTYGSYQKIDEHSKVMGSFVAPETITYSDLLKSCSIGCLTAMYDTQVLGKLYMPNIRRRQDFGLWLQILKKGHKAFSIGDVVAKYRLRDNSISSNKWIAARYQWKIYRDIEALSVLKSSWYFLNYFVKGIFKTYIR